MRRLLAAVILAILAVSATAAASHLDPQKKITPADQARARAMLLRKADLPGYRAQPITADTHLTCKALDGSDLTLTGEARTAQWVLGLASAASESIVYESDSDANTVWRRFTSAAGARCLEMELRREYARQGVKLVSLRKIAFPRLSDRTSAYRLTLSGEAQGQTIRVQGDLIVLMRSRAQVGLVFGSALVPPDRSTEVALARLTARRMAKAMRGA